MPVSGRAVPSAREPSSNSPKGIAGRYPHASTGEARSKAYRGRLAGLELGSIVPPRWGVAHVPIIVATVRLPSVNLVELARSLMTPRPPIRRKPSVAISSRPSSSSSSRCRCAWASRSPRACRRRRASSPASSAASSSARSRARRLQVSGPAAGLSVLVWQLVAAVRRCEMIGVIVLVRRPHPARRRPVQARAVVPRRVARRDQRHAGRHRRADLRLAVPRDARLQADRHRHSEPARHPDVAHERDQRGRPPPAGRWASAR